MATRRDDAAVRTADAGELDRLAKVRYDAWQDAHAAIVPAGDPVAFIEKQGWRPAATVVNTLETTSGTFLLDVWRYEKKLPPRV